MSLCEKYWLTILLMFCRYLSFLMMGSGVGFIVAGYYINQWFYIGVIIWPLLIMWGIVNIKYLRVVTKLNKLEFSKILEGKG